MNFPIWLKKFNNWKLNKATDDEVQFLLDELNEKRLRIIEGKTPKIPNSTFTVKVAVKALQFSMF